MVECLERVERNAECLGVVDFGLYYVGLGLHKIRGSSPIPVTELLKLATAWLASGDARPSELVLLTSASNAR